MAAKDEAQARPAGVPSRGRALLVGALLIVDFLLTIAVLATDKNLQTDFGAVPPYFSHWYGALGMGVLDLIAGGVVLRVAGSRNDRPSGGRRRGIAVAALLWPVVALLASLGIVATWSQVGFSSMAEFAKYLFGVSAYPGALPYVPGLYDLLIAGLAVTVVAAASWVRAVGRSP